MCFRVQKGQFIVKYRLLIWYWFFIFNLKIRTDTFDKRWIQQHIIHYFSNALLIFKALGFYAFQIAEGLSFLHGAEQTLHNNVCPSSILINKRGMWKLAGMSFSVKSRDGKGQYLMLRIYIESQKIWIFNQNIALNLHNDSLKLFIEKSLRGTSKYLKRIRYSKCQQITTLIVILCEAHQK